MNFSRTKPHAQEETGHGDAVPLTQLSRGQTGRVAGCHSAGCDAELVRSLGLDADALITVCRHGDPCIVRIHHRCGGSCRIGLRRSVGQCIMVHPAIA